MISQLILQWRDSFMVRSHQVLRWMRWRPFAPSSRRGLAMGISTSRARPLWISQKLGWNQANLGKLANWKQSLTLIFSSSLDEHGNLSDKDKDFNDISKISTTGPTNMESGGVSPRASDLFWHDLDSVDELKNTTFPLIHPQRICTKGWILNTFNGHPNTQKSHWYFYSNQFIATFFLQVLNCYPNSYGMILMILQWCWGIPMSAIAWLRTS